jgi:Polyketide cyclase / dehydrase and lipid transport
MLKIIVLIIAVIIAIVLLYAASKPDTFHVERSITINAAAEKIFPLINDFHAWNEWTPYNKDPAMQKTFSGAEQGVGAHYAWQGNKDVGKGDIHITASTPPHKVELNLHMIEPFEGGNNPVVFSLDAAGDVTKVTWAMDGTSHLMFKVMGLFISMDNMVGKDFEVGLAKLKTVAEK